MFQKWITQTNVLIVCGFLAISLLIVDRVGTFKLCGQTYGDCMDRVANTITVFLPILPLFAVSIIVYFMSKEVFRAWIKFALVWVPFTMLCTIAAPEYSPSLMPITKGVVSFWLSVIFFVVSVILIVVKHHSLKQSGK